MKVAGRIREIKEFIGKMKKEGKTVGFVPTMGYLHEGHVSLIKASKSDNGVTVLSIFVNPAQFGKNEDFDRYPRDAARDLKIASANGVDAVFMPEIPEIYPDGYKTYVNVEGITEVLCGKSRPGHFRGVTTIVSKLFNIIEPDRAYFGQKDIQQAIVIKKMASDLNMNVEIVVCPTVREPDGLAMSSRNVYLSRGERQAAVVLPESLFAAKDMIEKGERDKGRIIGYLTKNISSAPGVDIDYIEIRNADNLEEITEIEGRTVIAAAIKIGKTRLIDNVIIGN